MLEKTSGIVLHSFRYGETSIIARVFTRELGLQSYMIPGVRKTKAKIRQNLFQPLTLVDLVVYHKKRGGLQHIKEISCPSSYQSIPFDILKSSIAIFLSEMLTKSLKEQDPNPDMFDYISDALLFLDKTHQRVSDFHLVFLLRISQFLGFQPRNNYDHKHCFFNLMEGFFQQVYTSNAICLDKELSELFHQLNTIDLTEVGGIAISGTLRRTLLKKTIEYYQYHLDGIQEVRSHFVLEMVLN